MSALLGQALPLYIVLTSLAAAVLIFALGERRQRLRTIVNLAAALLKLGLIAVLLDAIRAGESFVWRLPLLPGLDLVLHADPLTLLFSTLSAVLWLLTTVYAIGYLERSPHRARFFGFFSLCVASTMGVAAAGNLFTFFVFYELLTLATWPLVAHRGTPGSLAGARSYLRYTLFGSALFLAGLVWLHVLAGPQDFIARGLLGDVLDGQAGAQRAVFVLLVAGLGVKAALVPLHGWLPNAMVAPAPVSALLHAVAVVKAGAFGIVRVVYDVYGPERVQALGMDQPLAIVAGITIVYGSLLALRQEDLKRRLAYSTVSQVSYIVLGTAIAGPLASVGGMVHLVHQGLMKITLFFCAGNYSEALGVKTVRQLDGIGRRMPWTSAAFTIGALGMIGLPPLAGFVSKWYLGVGAAAVGHYWVIGVLVASTLLNAAYFLPLLRRIWFGTPPAQWPDEQPMSRQVRLSLAVPPLLTALFALLAGLLAGFDLSPLGWVQFIVREHYG
ncbi:complex I subunit 5 family protein [Rehaibacterium terrae]|jgi:multicomponent Na+:H+ antiporter subunit D|uniref:Multicomponent Na+:H+ antiporter subunit D n=1 Tax=Rehaibacterium terrae TaxID=1341696 RepID=A0A7W7V765_9GAMM|nr:proton-conducting transporter membrane subunit [Rehaibacterium terrae]MBB5014387.1 multicomponent Na+:H+ antiporter subunit D [Rehaibacterium terrae]